MLMKSWSVLVVLARGSNRAAERQLHADNSLASAETPVGSHFAIRAHAGENLPDDSEPSLLEWFMLPQVPVAGTKQKRAAATEDLVDMGILESLIANFTALPEDVLAHLDAAVPDHTESVVSVAQKRHKAIQYIHVPLWFHEELLSCQQPLVSASEELLAALTNRGLHNIPPQLQGRANMDARIAVWSQLCTRPLLLWGGDGVPPCGPRVADPSSMHVASNIVRRFLREELIGKRNALDL